MIGPSVPALLLPADPAGSAGVRLRAGAFAAASVALAAAAHRCGGAGVPPWWLLVGTAWLLHLVLVPMAGRERTGLALAGAMVAVQAALHVGFAVAMAPGHMPGMAGPAMAAAPHESLLPTSGWMVLAHLAAALLLAGWLRAGERSLFAAARRWGSRVGDSLLQKVSAVLNRVRVLPVPPAASVPQPCREVPPPLVGRVLAASSTRRGPPVCAAA